MRVDGNIYEVSRITFSDIEKIKNILNSDKSYVKWFSTKKLCHKEINDLLD